MDDIQLLRLSPDAFRGQERRSGIWHQEVAFQKGRKYLIEAESGGGKSSLCSYIYGFRSDYRGEILFDHENIWNISSSGWAKIRSASLAILFQELRLFPELTSIENVRVKNNLRGFKTSAWIKECFSRLGIEDKMDIPLGRLSYGQQQRVAIIRTLSQPCDFILLDEPVSHIDDTMGKTAGELLQQEFLQQGMGMIITSIGKHPFMEYDKTIHL